MASTDHDNDIDVDELDSAAVAAAMGFSSFGAQAPPNKKRRFNPQADAVIGTPRDGRPPARLPPQSAGTGANATRLPPRPVKTVAATASTAATSSNLPLHPPHNSAKTVMKLPPPTKSKTDEIDLDDDDGDEDKDAGGGVHLEADGDDEPGPQYLDTSRPVGEVRDHLGGDEGPVKGGEDEDPVALQSRIDAVVAAGNAAYGVFPATAAAAVAQQQLDGAAHSTNRPHSGIRPSDRHGFHPDLIPGAGPQFGNGDTADGEATESEIGDGSSHVGSTDGRSQWQGRGHGQGRGGQGQGQGHGHDHGHQRDWWTGYYDPTSNENPWARIEDKLKLPSRGGSWLERGHGRSQRA